jgi:hypothetical protein
VAPSPQEEPFSEAHLGSPEYRERLMRKLNCLIAVLEVATAKVRKSMNGPSADSERLARICSNLQSTLEVCLRARTALERRQNSTKPVPGNKQKNTKPPPGRNLPATLPPPPPKSTPPKSTSERGRPRTSGSDISTDAERRKFAGLPPIERTSIEHCDIDDLARRLSS